MQPLGDTMKERLKNIGLDPVTHKQLRHLAVENDWTMTQAVEYLLERLRNDGNGSNQETTGSGSTAGDQPRKADSDGQRRTGRKKES